MSTNTVRKGDTPLRNVRVDTPRWDRGKESAALIGTDVSKIVRTALDAVSDAVEAGTLVDSAGVRALLDQVFQHSDQQFLAEARTLAGNRGTTLDQVAVKALRTWVLRAKRTTVKNR